MDNQILWDIIGETLKARATELAIAVRDARETQAQFLDAWTARDYQWLAHMGYIDARTLEAAVMQDGMADDA